MSDSTNTRGRTKRWAGAVGLLAAGVISGGVLASALSASASSTSAAGGSTASSAGSGDARTPGPGGAQPVRSDEKSVPSATAATLRAAALKAVAGGTVYRIETDAGDGVYEVHMTKADGSLVTVKFDKNLKVTKVESGMGAGDPAPPARPRRAPPRELAGVPSGRPRFGTNAGRGAAARGAVLTRFAYAPRRT